MRNYFQKIKKLIQIKMEYENENNHQNMDSKLLAEIS